jgi:formyltetrahydrofolate-dependent phosphoribosylglycinamide formyltransferase
LIPRIAVFASGSGSNFQAILDAIASGSLVASVCALVASKPGIGAIARAETHGIPVFIGDAQAAIDATAPDLIALAGYLKQIPASLIDAFPGRIVNIHPALLPKFGGHGMYGRHVHTAVLAAGETESGCTVHLVTEHYDEGPILAQARVPVFPGDTPESLAARVLEQEHNLFPSTLQQLLHGR